MKKPEFPSKTELVRHARSFAPAILGGVAGLVAVLLFAEGRFSEPEVSAPQPPRTEVPEPPPPEIVGNPSRLLPAPEPDPTPPPSITAPQQTAGQRALAPRLMPAWQRYAAVHPPADGQPRIAVIIDDMGVDRRRSARIAALPGPLTLAFLPYARGLPEQAAAARLVGHELMVHIPMEPRSETRDAGPVVLHPGDTQSELDRKLDWALARFDGFVGINNHMGSRFTADEPAMTALMRALKLRGLLFVDSRTAGNTVGLAAARKAGVPAVERDVFLDNQNDAVAVAAQLRTTESVARRKGTAVAIGHPRDGTLEALAQWLPTLRARGFTLVPVSAIVAMREARG